MARGGAGEGQAPARGRRECRRLDVGRQSPRNATGPSDEATAGVIEAAALNDAELGDYCRRRGIFPEQIAIWREACEQANDCDRTASARIARETKDDRKRIKDLERELARKEKALAEAAAGGFEKKGGGDLGVARGPAKPDRAVQWTDRSTERPEPCDGPAGGRRGRRTSAPDRRKLVEFATEAMAAGARRAAACTELGLHPQTLARWRDPEDRIRDDGRPGALRPEPANKLSDKERARIIATCAQPEFASRSALRPVPWTGRSGCA